MTQPGSPPPESFSSTERVFQSNRGTVALADLDLLTDIIELTDNVSDVTISERTLLQIGEAFVRVKLGLQDVVISIESKDDRATTLSDPVGDPPGKECGSVVTRSDLGLDNDEICIRVPCSQWRDSAATVVSVVARRLSVAVTNGRRYQAALQTAERYKSIFEQSPDGIVLLDVPEPDGEWLIDDCNRAFCEMNGYQRNELIGADILKVSLPSEMEENRLAYFKRLKIDGRIEDTVKHKTHSGRMIDVDFSSSICKIGGRDFVLGIDRDVSEAMEARRSVEDLRNDIGRTFHTLTSTLTHVKLALDAAIHSFEPQSQSSQMSRPIATEWPRLCELAGECKRALKRLLDSADASDLRKLALSDRDWTELETIREKLTTLTYEDNAKEMKVPALRQLARDTRECLSRVEKGRIAHQFVRDVQRVATGLEQAACCVSLRSARDRVMETDFLICDVRERVVTSVNRKQSKEVHGLWELVEEAIRGLSELANYKRVRIEIGKREDALVYAERHELVRCINNILHNAIKYSWEQTAERRRHITLSTERGPNDVLLRIEDYGVPIKSDEMDQIFRFGFRGSLAGERGRPGTGVGLYDSHRIAAKVGGTLTLDSRPAPRFGDRDDISIPHLKTAILTIPVAKGPPQP